MKHNNCKIEVLGSDWPTSKTYENIKSFAEEQGLDYFKICSKFKGNELLFDKYIITRLTPRETRKTHTKRNTANSQAYRCKVMCTNTGKVFSSISEAARSCGAKSWTMGLKMERAGKFIDANNNEYVRLSPMRSKNVEAYGETSPKLEHEVKEYKRKPKFLKKVIEKVETPVVTPAKNYTIEKPESAMSVASSHLENAAKALITASKYEEAMEIISTLSKWNTK